MKVLFISLDSVKIQGHSIYSDLMRKFYKEGHELYIVYPIERRKGMPTTLQEEQGVHYLGVHTLNIQQTNVLEKGIGTILLGTQFMNAIKKYFKNDLFNLILYTTPPITIPKLIGKLKRLNPKATTYLMLKDIFPQNAVDIGMLPDSKVRGPWFKVQDWVAWVKYQLYKYFRKQEKKLYAVTDYIGCMSPANVDYVIKNNPEVDKLRVEVCPNSVDLEFNDGLNGNLTPNDNLNRVTIRQKYGLPTDKPIFIYGGNLGKPQGIPFLIEALNANANRSDCHFLVIGTGTELPKLRAWYEEKNPKSVKVMKGLPKAEYEELVRACDVGLIFLDHRFTIPNYPSRILSYIANKMPVLCATDPNTDMGRIAEENGFGYWCESNSVEAFTAMVDKMIDSDRNAMGEKGYRFLKVNYLVQNTYDAIMKHFDA